MINEATDACVLEIRAAKDDENYPSLSENNAFNEPFEFVTELYSSPNSREMDPTPYLAPFFACFFGIMLSDAGYGIILIAAALFIKYKLR